MICLKRLLAQQKKAFYPCNHRLIRETHPFLVGLIRGNSISRQFAIDLVQQPAAQIPVQAKLRQKTAYI